MSGAAYRSVSGTIFATVALIHGWRAVAAEPATLGAVAIPVWWSWCAALGAAGLALWAFRARG